MQMQIKNYNRSFLVALVLLLFVTAGILSGWHIAPDSASYLQADIRRSPGYPLFIKLIRSISIDNFFFPILLFFQYSLGFAAAFTLSKSLRQCSGLVSPFFFWGTLILLLAPYFLPPYVGQSILSEALAYPMLLLFLACVIRGSLLTYLLAGLAFYVLLLTRSQFLVLFPVTLLWLFCFKIKPSVKNSRFTFKAFFACILTGMVLLSFLSDPWYHKKVHGQKVRTPFTFVLLNGLPFYLSEMANTSALKTQEQKAYFQYVHQQLESRKLTAAQQSDQSFTGLFKVYKARKAGISNQVMDDFGSAFFAAEDSLTRKVANEKMNRALFPQLWWKHAGGWIAIYFLNIADGLGGWFALPFWILFAGMLAWNRKHFTQKETSMLWLFFLIAAGNAAIVAVAEPLIHFRYAFYSMILTGLILWVGLFRLMQAAFKEKSLFRKSK